MDAKAPSDKLMTKLRELADKPDGWGDIRMIEPADARAILAALPSDAAQAPAVPVELMGVADELKNGDGFWRTCSGCHESEDGHPVGHYPFSEILNCDLGSGCRECGGIGAVWDDTDYGAMADAWDAQEIAREQAEEAQAPIMRFNIIGNLINPDPNGLYVRYEDHVRHAAPVAPASAKTHLTAEQVEQIMEQAQVFASAWSMVGGVFDHGDALETAEAEKTNLRTMLTTIQGAAQ